MIKKFLCLFFLLFVVISGCTYEQVYLDIKDNGQRDLLSFYVMADESLSQGQKEAIYEALAEWDIKIGQHIRYVVRFSDMSKEERDPAKYSYIYKVFIKDHGSNDNGLTILGYTTAILEKNSAIIDMKPDMESPLFRSVFLHELGHAMGLRFDDQVHYSGPYKSIMKPEIGNTNQLECTDLKAFCERYGCKITCTNQEDSIKSSIFPKNETCKVNLL